jgi:hypothetical protein
MSPHTACCLALSGALASMALSCASKPDASSTPSLQVSDVDPAGFRDNVEPVFERRCASMDCHGQVNAGMRLYSEDGLRLPNSDGLAAGSGPTSVDEINANYIAIVGLQPELVNSLMANPGRTADDVRHLLILAKPLQLERHKGGPALLLGEPAEECIEIWLLGQMESPQSNGPALCTTGAKPP